MTPSLTSSMIRGVANWPVRKKPFQIYMASLVQKNAFVAAHLEISGGSN